MTAKLIIEENIETLKQTLHTKNNFSNAAIHHVLGKINLAVELQVLKWSDACKYIDELFALEESIKP